MKYSCKNLSYNISSVDYYHWFAKHAFNMNLHCRIATYSAWQHKGEPISSSTLGIYVRCSMLLPNLSSKYVHWQMHVKITAALRNYLDLHYIIILQKVKWLCITKSAMQKNRMLVQTFHSLQTLLI